RTRVICSQRKVIPPLLEQWAEIDGMALPPARNRKGSVWVLSVRDGRLMAADHLDRALRVRTGDSVEHESDSDAEHESESDAEHEANPDRTGSGNATDND